MSDDHEMPPVHDQQLTTVWGTSETSTVTQSGGVIRRDADHEYAPAKRQAVPGPEREELDDLRDSNEVLKDGVMQSKKKEKQMRAQLDTLQKQFGKMYEHLQETPKKQHVEQQHKEQLLAQNRTLFEQLKSTQAHKDEEGRKLHEFGRNVIAQQKELYKELQSARAEKEKQEEKARELQRTAVEKANEAAMLRTKLANQASGITPRTSRGKTMNQVELCNMSTRIPVIPFTPIPIPATETSSTPPDSEDETSKVAGEIDVHKLAAEIARFLPIAALDVTTPTKKRRASSKQVVIHTVPDYIALSWKACLFCSVAALEVKCGVEMSEEFIFKTPPSKEDVLKCEQGLAQPGPDDFRFDFNPGYRQSKWNKIVLGKIADAAIIEGNLKHLDEVPREWLLEKLNGQLQRAHEAWARPQQRGDETEPEAVARANQYREERADNMRGNSAKAQKFDARKSIIELFIQLKAGKSAPDLEAWKRLLKMLEYLGNEGMSSSEEFERTHNNGRKSYVYIVKVCVWHAADVDQHLEMVDKAGKELNPRRKGPKALPRERDGTLSESGAPKGLPECLYDAAWIKKQSEASPVFYEDLEVSKEAFYLLSVAGKK
ncbi:hypothetical protein B0H11DRAFT_2235249 [Mycena galericulata]|nr:hypothetical protein B0H11DRAFT_2235249 [Mycena galericulata]